MRSREKRTLERAQKIEQGKAKSAPTGSEARSARVDPEALEGTRREERVRQRAYEIYLAGDREPGHAIEHWLQAEMEISRPPKRRV